MSKTAYCLATMVFDGFTDNQADDNLKDYIRSRNYYLHNRFVNRVNSSLSLWNAEYGELYPEKDGWCSEYSEFIFGKYMETALRLNYEIDDPYLEIWPQLIDEDPDRSIYHGQKEPVYGVRVRNAPEKKMHIEYGDKVFDSVEELKEYAMA